MSEILHAGLVARRSQGLWRGVLIRGASGSGKSDLTLRLIQNGWGLIADDRTLVWRDAGRLYGRAPDALRGLVEVRGLGVIETPVAPVRFGEIALIVDCRAVKGEIERLPDPAVAELLGVAIPSLDLAALEASAPLRLGAAFARV